MRDVDTVARLGGDEFIILLPGLHKPSDASTIANKLLACFAAPFQAGEHEFFTSASIGISLYPQDGTDVATLIRNADAVILDFTSRPFDPVEFSRMVAIADQIVAKHAAALHSRTGKTG